MKLKKGDEYESLIQYLYQTLSEDSGIQVFSKYKIKGKSKVEHEIDVYYEFLKNDVIHRVIIECKDWNTKVVKEKIEALKAKIDDIPNSVGIIVSKKGDDYFFRKAGLFVSNRYLNQKERYLEIPICEIGKDDV